MQEEVQRSGDLVGIRAGEPRQMAQLAENDQRRHPVKKAGHHGVGDEPEQEPQSEQARRQLNSTHQQHEHGQSLRALAIGDARQIGAGGHRQRRGRGHVHEDRAGGEGGDRRSELQRVDPEHRIDRRQQRMPIACGTLTTAKVSSAMRSDNRFRRSGIRFWNVVPSSFMGRSLTEFVNGRGLDFVEATREQLGFFSGAHDLTRINGERYEAAHLGKAVRRRRGTGIYSRARGSLE